MLAVMTGALLVVICLMTPVDRVPRARKLLAAIYGITGILFVLAGLGAVCIVAFRR
jgi:hypothetical protein